MNVKESKPKIKHEKLGVCFYCEKDVWRDEKSINIHGVFICFRHEITQRILAIEEEIINVVGLNLHE